MSGEPEVFKITMMEPELTKMNDEDCAVHIGAQIIPVSEFLEDVKWGFLIPYDGSARIKGGAQDNEYWDWETPIPADATHIEWYNR